MILINKITITINTSCLSIGIRCARNNVNQTDNHKNTPSKVNDPIINIFILFPS